MNVAVKWGVILAAAVALIQLVVLVVGAHASPMGALGQLGVFILVNIVAVFLALSATAGEAGYLRQLGNAAVVGLVGGVLIMLASWVLIGVVFPDALDQMRAGYADYFEKVGMPEAQIEVQMKSLEATTALRQAFSGLIGTFATSVVVGAVIAIFKRRK